MNVVALATVDGAFVVSRKQHVHSGLMHWTMMPTLAPIQMQMQRGPTASMALGFLWLLLVLVFDLRGKGD